MFVLVPYVAGKWQAEKMGKPKGWVKRCKYCDIPIPERNVKVCQVCKARKYQAKKDQYKLERQGVTFPKRNPVQSRPDLNETIAYQYLDNTGAPYVYCEQGRQKLEPVCMECGATHTTWGPVFHQEGKNILLCLACYDLACTSAGAGAGPVKGKREKL